MPRTTFNRQKLQVAIQPNIGLDTAARQSVVEMLNLLLGDETVLALKTCRVDGHAGGMEPADQQILFDAQCLQIETISNEIKERIQILGGSPLSDAAEIAGSARLARDSNAVPGILNLLADHEAFIRLLREDAQKCSEMYEDQGTFALLVSVMRMHEKMAWLLRSNIAPEHSSHEK